MGSPPPMRGKGIKPLTVSDVQGITPAYAGKRRGKSPVCHRTQDHPRLCGEKPAVSRSFSLSRGSPPPMRGKASPHSCRKSYAGITPAYAGKRHRSCAGDSRCEDHPRLCGEKMETGILDGQMMGSPPPMRGKDIYASDVVQQAGITPAYAGKSAPDTQWTHHIQDHPRLCGEKSRSPLWLATKIGSPPPMRGKVRKLPP